MTCKGCQKSNWYSLANLLDGFYLGNRRAYHSMLVQFCRKNQIISVAFFFLYTSKSKQTPNFEKNWKTSIGDYRSFKEWKHFSRSKIRQSVSIRFLAPTQPDIFYHSLHLFLSYCFIDLFNIFLILSGRVTYLKVSKFQNEFMKSSFLPKYKQKIVRISALCSEGRYPDIFLFVFWEKRSLHKFILKLTDL